MTLYPGAVLVFTPDVPVLFGGLGSIILEVAFMQLKFCILHNFHTPNHPLNLKTL